MISSDFISKIPKFYINTFYVDLEIAKQVFDGMIPSLYHTQDRCDVLCVGTPGQWIYWRLELHSCPVPAGITHTLVLRPSIFLYSNRRRATSAAIDMAIRN